MKFTSKDYQIIKLKNYIQTNNLFFFVNGVNFNSADWIKTEQVLKNYNFYYYKILNRITFKTLDNSIYIKVTPLINGITIFIRLQTTIKILEKKIIKKHLDLLVFALLAVKFNNKIYSISQFKKLTSLDYYDNKLLTYQFLITNFKTKVKFFEIM